MRIPSFVFLPFRAETHVPKGAEEKWENTEYIRFERTTAHRESKSSSFCEQSSTIIIKYMKIL